MDHAHHERASAVLAGYDDAVDADASPVALERERRERLEALARSFVSGDSEGEERRDGGVEDDWSDSESEREAWRAMERGVMSPALERSTRRRRGGDASADRARAAARSLDRALESSYESFAEAEEAVKRDGERALSAVAYASRRAGSRASTLEDSARSLMGRMEQRMISLERESDDFVAKRLEKAFDGAKLGEEAEEAIRERVRLLLTKQSQAFEQVIEAADLELVRRFDVASSMREKMRATFGETYVEAYERDNEEGHDATLTLEKKRRPNIFVNIAVTTVTTALKVVVLPVRIPLNVTTGAARLVFGVTKREVKRSVDAYRDFAQSTPAKQEPLATIAEVVTSDQSPFSPTKSTRSDVSSLATVRRWPLGATGQRVNTHKRYSVAGSVRSIITRKTIYSEVEYVSDEDNEEEEVAVEPEVRQRRRIVRALTRLIQLGCFTAVVSLSVGPGERAERSRKLALSVWNDVRVHVAKGWGVFLVKWGVISAKLSSTPAEQRKRTPTKVTRSKVPIQVPVYIPVEDEVKVEIEIEKTANVTLLPEDVRTFGHG